MGGHACHQTDALIEKATPNTEAKRRVWKGVEGGRSHLLDEGVAVRAHGREDAHGAVACK